MIESHVANMIENQQKTTLDESTDVSTHPIGKFNTIRDHKNHKIWSNYGQLCFISEYNYTLNGSILLL